MMELATLIAGLVTAAAVAGSVLFLARQTSQSVHQFLVANELAGARAMAQGYELWDHVIDRFIDFPELRQYFYEGVELPEEDPTTRARVLAMTELIGDTLQSAHWLYQGQRCCVVGIGGSGIRHPIRLGRLDAVHPHDVAGGAFFRARAPASVPVSHQDARHDRACHDRLRR